MTRRLFVCHANADIEATSELVDALENALNFSEGALSTSGLPGYSAEASDMAALGATLAASDVLLALVTINAVRDPQFHFQLGAAWALGAHTVLYVLDPIAHPELPYALANAPAVQAQEVNEWSDLIGDLSVRLGLVPRPGASVAPVLSPSYLPPMPPSSAPYPAPAPVTSVAARAELPPTSPRIPPLPAALDEAAPEADVSAVARAMATGRAAQPKPERARLATPMLVPMPPSLEPDGTPFDEELEPTAAELDAQAAAVLDAVAKLHAESEVEPARVTVTALDAHTVLSAVADREHEPDADADADAMESEALILNEAISTEPATQPRVKPLPPPLPAAEDIPAYADELAIAEAAEELPVEAEDLPAYADELPVEEDIPAYADELAVAEAAAELQVEEDIPAYADALAVEAVEELPDGEEPHPADRRPPRHSYIDQLRTIDLADELGALPLEDDADDPDTGQQPRIPARTQGPAVEQAAPSTADLANDSDVFARLPTCEMALEAGRAVSDCVFNRVEIDDFAAELNGPLGHLIECLGASWDELRNEQDLDTWVAVTDHLLQTLPNEVRKVEEWYRVGYELAVLHNLAGQLVLDGSDPVAEQHWRGALERFLMRAERAGIGYENLGTVLGLLENLVGPSHERDLSNIPRSLEELRRYAAGADIHTAA